MDNLRKTRAVNSCSLNYIPGQKRVLTEGNSAK